MLLNATRDIFAPSIEMIEIAALRANVKSKSSNLKFVMSISTGVNAGRGRAGGRERERERPKKKRRLYINIYIYVCVFIGVLLAYTIHQRRWVGRLGAYTPDEERCTR